MRKFLFITLTTFLLVGCNRTNNVTTAEETTEQATQEVAENTTESADLNVEEYFDSFEESTDAVQLSLSDGTSCLLHMPSNSKVNHTSSSSMIEVIIDDAYITFELSSNVADVQSFVEMEQERYMEKNGNNYDTALSFPLTEQTVGNRTVSLSRYSTLDSTLHLWYGIIPIEHGCVLVVYEASENAELPTNESVLQTMLTIVQ